MKVEAFEALLAINKGFDEAIGHLESLETIDEFAKQPIRQFCLEAKRLHAGINRYIAEHMRTEADQDCARLDKLLAPELKAEESSC